LNIVLSDPVSAYLQAQRYAIPLGEKKVLQRVWITVRQLSICFLLKWSPMTFAGKKIGYSQMQYSIFISI